MNRGWTRWQKTGILTLSVCVEFADHDVRWVTDDRTADPCNVSSEETHPRLLQTVVRFLGFSERIIDGIDGGFECREFDHRVGDLPTPQRLQSLIQPTDPLFRRDLGPPFSQTARVRRQGGLHPHFDGLERTQRNIRQELRRGTGTEVHQRLVRVGEHLIPVCIFEDFIKAVLARALETIADESRGPAEEDAAEAFGAEDGAPGGDIGGVDFGIDLTATFDLGFSIDSVRK